MFTLPYPKNVGDLDRFTIKQFDYERFEREWIAEHGPDSISSNIRRDPSIFAYDRFNADELGLDTVVFQDWNENINSFADIINTLRRRFPDSFTILQGHLNRQLNIFQDRYGEGKFPTQDVVDKWINNFYNQI